MLIIDRLRIRGKLNLLLLLPLAAVVLVTVPFLTTEVRNAQSSQATSDAARTARQLGSLVWELQQERLLTAGYLADRDASGTPMLLQQQVVEDTANSLRESLGSDASDELSGALVRLGSLTELRQSARERSAPLDSVARAYHAVIESLVDSLRLVPQRTSDAEGTRQLTALDSMLRANEKSALRGMALIVTAVSPQTGHEVLSDASAHSKLFTEEFVRQADIGHAALVVLVNQGEAARRIDELARQLPDPDDREAVERFTRKALAVGQEQAELRRLAQDRVTREIADAAAERADAAGTTAWTVGLGSAVLFALVAALSVVVSRSIAEPLKRLTRAAADVTELTKAELVRVTDDERIDSQPPRLAAIDVVSSDEVGELAETFNQVQTTATLLLERQVVTRRNVSRMFANVAQRTQNLVRRQLTLIDELERDEQDTRLLTRLYALDHLSNRLRRNAENLLVVAGSTRENRMTAPAPLSVVLRSALADIEDYQRVTLRELDEGIVSGPLVPDLALLFAELLDNATRCSPPDRTVDVRTVRDADGWCQVSIVDRGIGMAAQRLAEENRRLVERERLDVAPISVLGLFVVGRLARRHGLVIELVPTPGQGITATVAIPPALCPPGTAAPTAAAGVPRTLPGKPVGELPPAASGAADGSATGPARPRTAADSADERGQAGPAARREDQEAARPQLRRDTPAQGEAQGQGQGQAQARGIAPAAGGVPRGRGPLKRRVPGAQLPAEPRSPAPEPQGGPVHDASAVRTALDGLESAFARAAGPLAASGGIAPLVRRTPGASVPPDRRTTAPSPPARVANAAPQRDPDADRESYDGFAAAWAKAEEKFDSGPS